MILYLLCFYCINVDIYRVLFAFRGPIWRMAGIQTVFDVSNTDYNGT